MTVMASPAEEFPIVDFSKFGTEPEKVSEQIFHAASRWGFLVLAGHGIPQEDVDDTLSRSRVGGCTDCSRCYDCEYRGRTFAMEWQSAKIHDASTLLGQFTL